MTRLIAIAVALALGLSACGGTLGKLGFKPGSHPYSKDTVDQANGGNSSE